MVKLRQEQKVNWLQNVLMENSLDVFQHVQNVEEES